MYNQGMLTSFNPGPDSRLRKSQFCTEGSGYTFGRELGWNFSQEQNINHTMDIDLRADQVVLSRAPRKIMHMCGSLNGLKKILVLLWLFQYIMTGIGCNLKGVVHR